MASEESLATGSRPASPATPVSARVTFHAGTEEDAASRHSSVSEESKDALTELRGSRGSHGTPPSSAPPSTKSHPASLLSAASAGSGREARQRNESCHSEPAMPSPAIVFEPFEDDFKRSSTRGPRKLRRYYRRQSDLMRHYNEDSEVLHLFEKSHSSPRVVAPVPEQTPERVPTPPPPRLKEAELMRRERVLAQLSLALNVLLLIAKTAAVVLSGSLSIISSLVDSAVDITSGLVIWQTSRAIANRDPYLYPRGRTRLEPLALVIISVVMAVASVQMIVQSAEAMVRGNVEPDVGLDTILIMVATIVTKAGLAVACRVWGGSSGSVAVLAQDHRNDCVSNSVAIACAYVGSHWWAYLDPLGAILVSLYIALTWFYTGYGHIAMLSGRAAPPAFVNRILKICLEHHPLIRSMDTVYVYHYGTKYLVEVHVVMDGALSLAEAHDISEPLQLKLEALPYVERAFVHVDYESDHRPEDEHKVV